MLRHCAMNRSRLRRAIVLVDHSDSGTVSTVIRASSGEIVTIITSTATTVSTDVSSWLMVSDSEDAMLSTSLVTRLSTSPRCRESKYDRGSRCTLSSTSERSATMVRWMITLSRRACTHITRAASRYRASASSSVRPIASKSTPRPGMTFIPDSRSAKVPSPRARAASIACALVIPAGSSRPTTPLNSRSVACPRISGPTTPIAMPTTPSTSTIVVGSRCGVSRLTNRSAEPVKSLDRSAGVSRPAFSRRPTGPVTVDPWRRRRRPTANRRTARTPGSRRAARRAYRYPRPRRRR